MTGQITDVQEKDETGVTLSDLDEDTSLTPETSNDNRRRKLFVLIVLIALAALISISIYYLLHGEKVDLRADKKLPEKVSSGSDIRKAAYDSISDSLTSSTSSPNNQIPAIVTSPGLNQATMVTPGSANRERVSAPIQPSVTETLAAPPEANPDKVNSNLPAREQSTITSPSKSSTTLVTALSIRFAPTPKTSQPIKAETSAAGGDNKDASQRNDNNMPSLINRDGIPSFGAMLPVRLLGVLYTLRPGSLARLELMRDLKTEHWQMKRGTVFIGNVIGGDADRAYLRIESYIDPDNQRLVKIEAEVLGDDGGAGLRGKQRRISPAWIKVLDRAAQAGVQIATGVLGRGASSVIIAADPYGTIRSTGDQTNGNRTFVEVAAGAVGFVMVTALPKTFEPESHLAEFKNGISNFAESELAELITLADPARIRAAMPRMSPELRQIAQMVVKEIESVGR